MDKMLDLREMDLLISRISASCHALQKEQIIKSSLSDLQLNTLASLTAS